MTPPTVPGDGTAAPSGGSAGARAPRILRKRADFLRASRGLRAGTAGFHLQARAREAGETADGIRIGYTCSKKVGNSVARNRAKRRLREIARAVLPLHGRPGWDYVLVGRPEVTGAMDFAQMKSDLARALDKLHREPDPGDRQ